jgi:hypothetical protein
MKGPPRRVLGLSADAHLGGEFRTGGVAVPDSRRARCARFGVAAPLNGRNMRAHSTTCPKRPAASDHTRGKGGARSQARTMRILLLAPPSPTHGDSWVAWPDLDRANVQGAHLEDADALGPDQVFKA